MDSIDALLSGGESAAPAPGELIVQNGRQAGASRCLQTPLTLIGRAPGCDVRLNVDTVHPYHCAILPGPAGLVLRDLGSITGTLVNNQRVSSCLLRDGDLLAIGPFVLQVRWHGQPEAVADPVPRSGEVDALRVQAAAVAAQQAGLLEEENRLEQRKVALERQEEQLSAHLEEKRQNLVNLRDEIKREREQVLLERTGLNEERQTLLGEASRDREEAGRTLEQAKTERQRLSRLRRRLRQRWKKHWNAREKETRSRERAAERRTAEAARQCQHLEAEKAQLKEARLQLNGERELTRCELREQWQKLRQAQQDWHAEREKMAAGQALRQMDLEERARAVQEMERQLAIQRQQTQTLRSELVRETQGLETRVQNLRQAIAELQASGESNTSSAVPVLRVLTDEETTRVLRRLEIVAAGLADQRLALVEQWQHFLRTQQDWHAEHAEVLPELYEAAQRLEERERRLDERERGLQSEADALRQRQESLNQLRSELEAWQSRLSVEESAWGNERTALKARSERIEELARRRVARLEEVRQQWAVRRKDETTRLGRELLRCRELQRLYTALREETDRRTMDLAAEQRSLAERTLAVEQLELERVGQAEDAAAVEKRLQKIRKHLSGQYAEEERRLAERGRHLEEEAHRLSVQAQQLHQRLESAAESEAALSTRQTEWEHRLTREEQAREQLQEEVEELRGQEKLLRQRSHDLQEELERLINALLQDAEPLEPPLAA